jgi:hypothetical protein
VGSIIRDQDTIERYIIPDFSDESGDELGAFIDSSYNGVDHRLVSDYFYRFLYDNLINIILVFILLNMIQGIIIDTFGSLRE